MKVMMVAGEASGDLHGAHLARALLEREPSLELLGMGGELMKEAGVRLLFNATAVSAMGFVEVLRSVPLFRRLLARMQEVLDQERPDVLVLIDFPEFNMRLGERAHERSIPVVYYFSPSAWAWRRGRAKTVAAHATTVCAVFPFEAEVYREAGANVEFVGHPLIDIVNVTRSPEQIRRELGCADAQPLIALLPGSRKQEIDHHMTPLVAAARRIREAHPRAAFLLPLAHTIDRARVEPKVADEPSITIVEGRTYDVLAAVDAALAASGTVTLEAALIGTPIAVFYRTSASTYWIAKRFYKRPHISLPNIIAEREIVEEILQDEMTPQRLAEAALSLLDPARRERIREGYDEVRRRLGGPGAVGRAADAVLRAASGGGGRAAQRTPVTGERPS
mgnify:CR=1 FL=1